MYTAATGQEPWVTDGTAAGTHLLADLVSGAGWSQPQFFTPVGDGIAFVTFEAVGFVSSSYDMKVWVSDGTAAGTVLVYDQPGIAFSMDASVAAIGDTLYFSAASAVGRFGESVDYELYAVHVPEPAALTFAAVSTLCFIHRGHRRRKQKMKV
jgi:ELWxxDGT repeat protein